MFQKVKINVSNYGDTNIPSHVKDKSSTFTAREEDMIL